MNSWTALTLAVFAAAVSLATCQGTEVITSDRIPGSGTFHHIAVDTPGHPRFIYACDTSRNVIHRKDVQSGSWEVFAGQDGKRGAADGPATEALFDSPTSICLNPSGALVVADSGNACIRQVSPKGMVSTLAGQCGKEGASDGPAAQATFSRSLKSIVCLSNCSVLVGDVATGRLRTILVHDSSCVPGPQSQQGWYTTLQLLLAAGGGAGFVALAAAAVLLFKQRYKAVEAHVQGYRELREAQDPTPPLEARRGIYRLKGALWNLRRQAAEQAEQAASRGCLGSASSGSPSCPGSTGIDAGAAGQQLEGHWQGGTAGSAGADLLGMGAAFPAAEGGGGAQQASRAAKGASQAAEQSLLRRHGLESLGGSGATAQQSGASLLDADALGPGLAAQGGGMQRGAPLPVLQHVGHSQQAGRGRQGMLAEQVSGLPSSSGDNTASTRAGRRNVTSAGAGSGAEPFAELSPLGAVRKRG